MTTLPPSGWTKLKVYKDYSHLPEATSVDELLRATSESAFLAHAEGEPVALPCVDYSGNETLASSNPKLPRWRPESWWNRPIRPPALSIVRLNNGVHAGGSVLLDSELSVIPNSFARYSRASYDDDTIMRAEGGGWVRTREVNPTLLIDGEYFFLGELPDQYGHFILEVLPRLWALNAVRPERFLGFSRSQELFDWQWQLLALAGVDRKMVTLVTKPCRIESLIIADSAHKLHTTASRVASDVFRGMSLEAENDGLGPRIFFTRRSWVKRRVLINEDEVEKVFENHGFEIVAPENLTVDEQVSVAREARSLAGAIGSGMYNAAFQRPKCRNFILAPHDFGLRDDQLVAYVTGGEVAYFFSADKDVLEDSTRLASWRIDIPKLEVAVEKWMSGELG